MAQHDADKEPQDDAEDTENRRDALVSRFAIMLVLVATTFWFGIQSARTHNWAYRAVDYLQSSLGMVLSDGTSLLGGGDPIHFLQPARHEGEGVTINKTGDDGRLILLSGFFDGGNQIRLIRRDGSVVRKWPLSYFGYFPDASFLRTPPQSERNVDTHGTVLNPDGSVVVNFEYAGTVKLDRCGATEWTVEAETHHSVEKAEGGGYWVAGRDYVESMRPGMYPPFTEMTASRTYKVDTIIRIDEDGRIVKTVSIPGLLLNGGLESVMTATGVIYVRDGSWDNELVHANKIAELDSRLAAQFPMFEAGDLAISLRQYNLVFVVDPDTWEIKWHQTGPWLRQHDPEFEADGTISVFNNNIYWNALGPGDVSGPDIPRVSNIMKIDPATRQTRIVFGNRPGQEFVSVIRGKHDPMPNGGLVTEFEAGRVFQYDDSGRIVWEYINRHDAQRVGEVSEARIYDAGYFTVDGWDCPG